MMTLVDDNRQCVSLCGMTPAHFLALLSALRQAKNSPSLYVQALSVGLHLSYRWVLNTDRRSISLLHLTWEEVLVLEAFIVSWRVKGQTDRSLGEILEALDAAVEPVTRVEEKSKCRSSLLSSE